MSDNKNAKNEYFIDYNLCYASTNFRCNMHFYMEDLRANKDFTSNNQKVN